MESIRDSAFGKLVRLASGRKWLKYPEEAHSEGWQAYVRKKEETTTSRHENLAGTDACGLYTVISQVSRARSSRTSLAEPKIDLEKLDRAPSRTECDWIVTWTGKEDSENPQNWSTTKKLIVSGQVWLLTFTIYLGSSIYTPGIPGVAEDFQVSIVTATLGLTLFVAGYGLGPMVWSPLSEILFIGRSPIYVSTLGLFAVLQFTVIYATNLGMLLVFRFITGFIGSPALAMGAGSMADIWNPQARDHMIGMWGCFAVSAPVLGPAIGGFAFMAEGWAWTIWPLLWLSAFTFFLLFFSLPETYTPNILCRKARRIRRITGDDKFKSESENDMAESKIKDVIFEALIRPFQLCFGEVVVLVMNIFHSSFEGFPIVFGEIHGFNAGEVGLSFLGLLVSANGLVLPGYFIWKWKVQTKHFDKDFNIVPEMQIPPAFLGALCLPVSLFWFGWTSTASIHWVVPILASMLFSVSNVLVFNSIFTYQTQSYPLFAASVLAGNDFMRSSFGAGFALFASAMFHNLGVDWACTVLGCLTLLFVPFPFVLYYRGKKLRMSSKYARHDI
ncbi:MFS general substrate transporter [Aulographum hederae CBS 113979]|uniref:MFS general substrate transporter n=1 Tax=Aulographum hederae CBS 113979 TaxID=1176131 RepID=A0A6G1H457_9PEZI|nr:MFS general substrate transporter [Aulographum hederae CBS 113979]